MESIGISIPENKNPWAELFNNYRCKIQTDIGKKNLTTVFTLQEQGITLTLEELSKTYQFSDENAYLSAFGEMVSALNNALHYELWHDAEDILKLLTETMQDCDKKTVEFILLNKIEHGSNELYWLMSSLSIAIRKKMSGKIIEIIALASMLIEKCSSDIFEDAFLQKVISGTSEGTSPLYWLMGALCNSAALEMWSVMDLILRFFNIIMKKCSAEKLKIAFSQNDLNGDTPFHFLIFAINNTNIENKENIFELIISLIDKINCIPYSQKDNQGFSLLHYAVFRQYPEAVEILLKNKANPNEPDTDGKTPLHYALWMNSIDIINLILRNKGNPCLYDKLNGSALKYAVNKTRYNHNVFIALLSHKPHLQELYLISKNENENEVGACIDKYYDLFLSKNIDELENNIEELECLSLRLVNEHCFISAEIILFSAKILTLHKNINFNSHDNERKEYLLNSKLKQHMPFKFPYNMADKRKEAIISAFEQITNLFSNPDHCIELLKELDQQIKAFEPFLQCNFATVVPGIKIRLYRSLQVPSFTSPTIPHTHGLLHFLIRKKLQSHGIEKQDELYTFSGFVNSKIADNIVRNGGLFKEQFLMGNALSHGIYPHYLQWYLIAAAVEKNMLVFDDNITLCHLLSAAVDVQSTQSNFSLWGICFDFASTPRFNKNLSDFNVGAPHRLNSLLFFSDSIPHLRGYLINSFFKNIVKFQKHVKNEYQKDISYLAIVGASAIAHNLFNLFDLGYDNHCVKKYYREQAKTGNDVVNFDEQSGILIKSAKKRFRIIEAQYNILFPPEQSADNEAQRNALLAGSFFSVKSQPQQDSDHSTFDERKKSVDVLATSDSKATTRSCCNMM